MTQPAQLSSLSEMLARMSRPVHLLGEGLPYHEPGEEERREGGRIARTPPEQWPARAEVVAQIGWRMARAGQFADAVSLTPIYLRKPEAEEKYEERVGRQ